MLTMKKFFVPIAIAFATLSIGGPGAAQMSHSAATIAGGATSVRLVAAPTLVGLGLKIRGTGLSFVGGNVEPVATFLITGGTAASSGSVIRHDGSGLVFSAKTARLAINNFVIDTKGGVLTGDVNANGTMLKSVPLFTIANGTQLKLTKEAAGAFTSIFGAPDLTGALIGTARISRSLDVAPPSEG